MFLLSAVKRVLLIVAWLRPWGTCPCIPRLLVRDLHMKLSLLHVLVGYIFLQHYNIHLRNHEFRLHYYQYFYQDTISRWLATKARDSPAPNFMKVFLLLVKLPAKSKEPFSHWFYIGVFLLLGRLLAKAKESFQPMRHGYPLPDTNLGFQSHGGIIMGVLLLHRALLLLLSLLSYFIIFYIFILFCIFYIYFNFCNIIFLLLFSILCFCIRYL